MPSELRLSFNDHSGKKSRTKVRLETVTAANFDDVAAAMTAVRNAIDGISVGVIASEDRLFASTELSTANAADADAHRGQKWLVQYADTVDPLGSGSFEIPCPDSGLLVANTVNLNMASGAGLTFKQAIETNMVSRAGNPITITKVTYVNRSV